MSRKKEDRPEQVGRIFSFGGGWQSIAVLLLQIEGKIPRYDVYIYANVDDRAEPDTMAYMDAYIKPLAEKHNIPLITVTKMKNGKPYGLLDDLFNGDNNRVSLPMWNDKGGANHRICTSEWKIGVVNKWVKDKGYTHVTMGMGISMDESERMNPHAMQFHDRPINKEGLLSKGGKFGFLKRIEYPLIDLRIWREQLESIFARHNLPTPPKSACFFCPFSNRTRWIELKRNKPELFAQAIEIEKQARAKLAHMPNTHPYLHVSRQVLEVAVSDQLPLWDLETGGGCDSGTCFT